MGLLLGSLVEDVDHISSGAEEEIIDEVGAVGSHDLEGGATTRRSKGEEDSFGRGDGVIADADVGSSVVLNDEEGGVEVGVGGKLRGPSA